MSDPLYEIGVHRYLSSVAAYNRHLTAAVEEAEELEDVDLGPAILEVFQMAVDAMAVASEFGLDLEDPVLRERLLDPSWLPDDPDEGDP